MKKKVINGENERSGRKAESKQKKYGMKISEAASNEMAIMYEMAAAIMAKYRNQRKGEIGVSMKTSGAWRQWRKMALSKSMK
jgi:hypothetical protein